MSAIITATIGWLVDKGRDEAAKKLKDGDVTDQQFRGIIVREIDDMKSKLDGLSRKVLASLDKESSCCMKHLKRQGRRVSMAWIQHKWLVRKLCRSLKA